VSFPKRRLRTISDAFTDFLDHAIRETPTKHMKSIKRLFFPRDSKRADLTNVVEVIQGMYASIRMNQV
jgi:eukaryotic translation initiation factor 2C